MIIRSVDYKTDHVWTLDIAILDRIILKPFCSSFPWASLDYEYSMAHVSLGKNGKGKFAW